ncbi:hypothetical protein C4D60_Mb05t17240 [Musa balbisiana]|uniref:Uncharacterized protein n=1 Tax=Musa balbisiana TaxID=52838 RepID=A0A4S8JWS9_MUSBA|nr:hypothetical protein C4D60_Mb05t17240 [Musa balbisiana]
MPGGNNRNFDRYHPILPRAVRYGVLLNVLPRSGRSAYRYAIGSVIMVILEFYKSFGMPRSLGLFGKSFLLHLDHPKRDRLHPGLHPV